jgi:dienelactone hydrolase
MADLRRGISRREVLIGALGVAAASGIGALALRSGTGAVGAAGTLRSGTFVSAARHGLATGYSINWPPGHGPTSGQRPLRPLVVLHGRGGNHSTAFSSLHLDRYLSDLVAAGSAPFAIASVDGGDHGYWHPRTDGDTAAMVINEFVPLLHQQGLDVTRIGLLGWSMGGYGALYLSTVLRRSRVAVAVAESPAIWHHWYQSAAGAFDEASDFQAHPIFGRQQRLAGIALRIDCGASDGFAPVTRDLRASLHPTPAGGIEPGGHDATYWRSQASAQLSFVGQHLPA